MCGFLCLKVSTIQQQQHCIIEKRSWDMEPSLLVSRLACQVRLFLWASKLFTC